MKKLVSIIIVNYNGKKWLDGCLKSLLDQTYKEIEIIVVDNASTDGSVNYVIKKYKSVKLVRLETNSGFAGGNNEGVKTAKGEYIILLNNDTRVNHDYVKNFISVFKKYPKAGIAQSKIVLMNDPKNLDTCGAFWTDTSFLYYIGNSKNESLDEYNHPFKIFAAKGASVIIRRAVIKKIGLFDPDFWNYYEETDLCHRAWVCGYEVVYWPKAVCFHSIGGTSLTFKNEYIQFHNYKNKLCSFIKNLEFTELLKTIAVFIFFNLLISFVWVITGKWRHALSLYKGIFWNITNIQMTIEKRNIVQRSRVFRDFDIWKTVKYNPKAIYYKHLFLDNLGAYRDQFKIE